MAGRRAAAAVSTGDPVPIPPSGAKAPRSAAERMAARQKRIKSARGSTSRSLRLVQQGLTSAAEVLTADGKTDAKAPNSQTRTWQHAAMGYRRSVPELNASMLYVGNCLARVKLKVGKRNPDGTVEDGFDGAEPVDGLDAELAKDAADIIAQLRVPIGGQSELLRAYGEKMFMIGELYLLPIDSPSGMVFEVLSPQELIKSEVGGLPRYAIYNGPGYDNEEVDAGVEPIRIYRRDPQFRKLATSSVQSCLEILEELVVLTRLVRAAAISRMALAGILAIADEFDTAQDDGTDADGNLSENTSPLLADIINTGCKAIDDPASAAAWMPYLLQGPADLIERGIKHIPFQTDDTVHVVKRREALERLAQGLDLPMEVVLGHQSTTFANATQISEDTFKIHIEPTVQMFCDAVTNSVLWPGLATRAGLGAERVAQAGYPDEFLTVAVAYDASELISRPDRTKDIIEAFIKDPTQMAVRISELRLALGLDPDEVPDDDEVAKRIDAIRLTKIREVINAPASDAATTIEDAADAVVPGQSAGAKLVGEVAAGDAPAGTSPAAPAPDQAAAAALQQAAVTAALQARIAGAVEMAVERAAEKVGAKLRPKTRGVEREAIEGMANADVARVLGPAVVQRLLGDDDPMAAELATFARMVARWAADSGHPHPGQVAEAASGLASRVARDRLYSLPREVPVELCASLVARP